MGVVVFEEGMVGGEDDLVVEMGGADVVGEQGHGVRWKLFWGVGCFGDGWDAFVFF